MEIKEAHTDGLRGAGRAHREAPCSESGVWGGALCSSPPCSPPGMHRKPSLSTCLGASVPQGENVTLQCRSEVQSDTCPRRGHSLLPSTFVCRAQLHLFRPTSPCVL